MKRLVICSIAGLVLSGAMTVQAQQVANTNKTQPITAQAVNNQTAVACNLCFTCGGDWPVFAGSFTTVGNFPTERAGSCTGALIVRSDTRPFLCCR